MPEPPADLPQCACFTSDDKSYVWLRCTEVAKSGNAICEAFHEVAKLQQLCPTALSFYLELTLVSLLAYVVKSQGPAIKYGSEEMERESDRILSGLEARVLARSRDAYRRGRELGLTEEVVVAMRERAQSGEQS